MAMLNYQRVADKKVWGKMVMLLMSQYKNHTVLLSSAALIEHGVLSSIVQLSASSNGRGGVKVPLQIATRCPHYRLCHSISVLWSHMILNTIHNISQYHTCPTQYLSCLSASVPSKCRTPRALCIHRRRYLGWRNQRQAPKKRHCL